MPNLNLNGQATEDTLGHVVHFGWTFSKTPAAVADTIRWGAFGNFAIDLSQDYRFGVGGDVDISGSLLTANTYPAGGFLLANPLWGKEGGNWVFKGDDASIDAPSTPLNMYRICMWNASKDNRVFVIWVPATEPYNLQSDAVGRDYPWSSGVVA